MRTQSTSTFLASPVELRLARAERIAAEATQILRTALAGAEPGAVATLLEEIDDFFSILEAMESLLRDARAANRGTPSAKELALDAELLAIAARRDARIRAAQLCGATPPRRWLGEA
ncbi:hypothetical protein [Sandaracinus amylolyticus]|uniref:hypothetical protein n=1 Tax=Sandaracinus amylolyticus TaxID=927083 RepID=UPI001F345E7B|nr:hypothetical protein [Sandaracinus amylolyticus]UJR86483.1 Hypothetical protein I5071_85780 [Sandaracinus amylolyticus]